MRGMRAFLLGALAVGLLAYALAAALAVLAQAGGRTLDIAFGPLGFVSVTEDGATTVTAFGSGIVCLAVVGGLTNLAAASVLRRRARAGADHVD
jgi:hypothetical protein